MIKALDARRITDKVNGPEVDRNRVNDELVLAEQEIIKAANKGYNEIGIEILPGTMDVLENNGYNICPGEDCTLVSW